jgi:DNA-binding NarL/FixJ family response regulator
MAGFRVLVADDHGAYAESIKAALPPQFRVIATVRSSDHQALRRTALKLQPDVILLRFEMATAEVFQVVKEIFQRLPRARIVFYANAGERDPPDAKTSSGVISAVEACGFIANDVPPCIEEEPPRAALSAIPSALKPKGNITLDPGSHSFPAQGPDRVPPSQEVTDREYEVLALLAAGHPMKCIAHRLGITYRTVTFHKYRMMERLGISTNAGLMIYALKSNMGIRHDEGVRTA